MKPDLACVRSTFITLHVFLETVQNRAILVHEPCTTVQFWGPNPALPSPLVPPLPQMSPPGVHLVHGIARKLHGFWATVQCLLPCKHYSFTLKLHDCTVFYKKKYKNKKELYRKSFLKHRAIVQFGR